MLDERYYACYTLTHPVTNLNGRRNTIDISFSSKEMAEIWKPYLDKFEEYLKKQAKRVSVV